MNTDFDIYKYIKKIKIVYCLCLTDNNTKNSIKKI